MIELNSSLLNLLPISKNGMDYEMKRGGSGSHRYVAIENGRFTMNFPFSHWEWWFSLVFHGFPIKIDDFHWFSFRWFFSSLCGCEIPRVSFLPRHCLMSLIMSAEILDASRWDHFLALAMNSGWMGQLRITTKRMVEKVETPMNHGIIMG